MKYIKMFDSRDLFSQPKFKEGDYVRVKNGKGLFDIKIEPEKNYFRIDDTDYNNVIGSDTYFLVNILYKGFAYTMWEIEDNLELIPDHEITARKYNL